MKEKSTFDYEMLGGWITGVVVVGFFVFLFAWGSSNSDTSVDRETQMREEYETEQMLNANNEREACIDEMERDVRRYGEWVVDTYDC